jgi:predicted phosphohydrolase
MDTAKTKEQPLIQVCSDLHLEYDDLTEADFGTIIVPTAEILILAGDIGNPFSLVFRKFIAYCSKNFTYVLFVSGNHEYYGYSIPIVDSAIEKFFALSREIPKKNVIYLNNKTLDYEGIRFVGTTLWSELNPKITKNEYITVMQDYTKIDKFTPELQSNYFQNNKRFIESHLRNQKCVVITHHAPSYKCIEKSFEGDKFNCCFASNLDNLLEHPNLIGWIYGHLHHNVRKYNTNKNDNKKVLYSNCYRTDNYTNASAVI